MSAQRGKDILLKIGDGGAPESFSTLGGLRTRTLALNAQTVDITNSDSPNGWRELLAGAGVRSAGINGSGVFLNDAAAQAARTVFFTGEIRNWSVIVPGLGTIDGPFQITSLDYAGEHDGEATMAISIESAGALLFTPEGA